MSKFRRLAVLCLSMAFPWLAAAAEFPVDKPVAEDTPASTVAGNPFTIPAGWSVSVKGPATIITPPEGGDSHIVFVDVEAEDAESAVDKEGVKPLSVNQSSICSSLKPRRAWAWRWRSSSRS